MHSEFTATIRRDDEEVTVMDRSEMEIPIPAMPNSGAGIASVVIGLITLFLGAVVYSAWSSVMSFAFTRQTMSATGFSFAAIMQNAFLIQATIRAGASVAGIVAAIFGLCQTERRKDLAYVGLALNVILLLSALVNMGMQYVMRVLRF